jgi:hypothetical protein
MRVGFVLPDITELAGPEAIDQIARAAESLDYDSLWVTERELFPAHVPEKNTVYDGRLPEASEPVRCPFQSLAIAARGTRRIRLGVSLPNVAFYSPIAVAGSMATLDVLSGGRVEFGLGLGSSADEFQFVAATLARPDSPAGEFVRVLDTIWACRDREYRGDYYVIPRAASCAAPVQRPHPPVYLTAFAPAAVQRPAVLLRGGSPVVVPAASADPLFSLGDLPGFAVQGIGVRALVQLHDEPLGRDRALFAGSRAQVMGDLRAAIASDASDILVDLSLDVASQTLAGVLASMRELRDLVSSLNDVPLAA